MLGFECVLFNNFKQKFYSKISHCYVAIFVLSVWLLALSLCVVNASG